MKYLNALLFLFVAGSLASCREATCGEMKTFLSEDEFNIIYLDTPASSYRFHVDGISPKNNKDVSFHTNNNSSFYHQMNNVLESGDTLVKRKGNISFELHKSDTTIIFKYYCRE
jgi:hypothetical protein